MSDRDMYIKQLEEKLTHVVRGTGRTTVCMSVLDLATIVNLLKEQQETIELQGSLLTLAHAAMNQKRKKDKD